MDEGAVRFRQFAVIAAWFGQTKRFVWPNARERNWAGDSTVSWALARRLGA